MTRSRRNSVPAADGGDAGLDTTALLALTRERLERLGTPERAEHEKRYLKSDLTFLGVDMPKLRRAAKTIVREHPNLERTELLALMNTFWASGVHELRSVAIGVLELRTDRLRAADLTPLLQYVREAKTWAHVDWLAIKVLGAIVAREPNAGRLLDRWARDPDFWVRRTALLCLHDPLLRGRGDFEHFAALAVQMLDEREFFIRKAIGWMLRSTAKRTPEHTIAFVAAHARALSGLSFREAVRNLPARDIARLTALRERSKRASGD